MFLKPTLLVFFIALSVLAQIGSTPISEPSLGIEFDIPAGWSGQKIDGGYLFGSATQKGFILVSYHSYKNLDEIRSAAAEGFMDENGTNLSLNGSLKSAGQHGLAGEFTGTVEWQEARAYAAGVVSPYGTGGITILSAVEAAGYSSLYPGLVDQIVQSIKFSQPKVTPLAAQWKEKLKDCRLTYMNSYNSGYGSGGYQDKTVIDLCSAGYFRYNDQSQTVINAGDYAGGYSSGSAAGSGEWNVVVQGSQAFLQLKFNRGEIYEYRLSEQDGKTFLNDSRYFRTYSNSAVEEARPECY